MDWIVKGYALVGLLATLALTLALVGLAWVGIGRLYRSSVTGRSRDSEAMAEHARNIARFQAEEAQLKHIAANPDDYKEEIKALMAGPRTRVKATVWEGD